MDKDSSQHPGIVPHIPNVINLDSDDGYPSDGTLMGDDLVGRVPPMSETHKNLHRSRTQVARSRDLRALQTHSYGGRTLKSGKTVEIVDGCFIRITVILKDYKTGEIFLKGRRFQRNRSLDGLLECKLNEVTLMMEHDPDDHPIELAVVVKIRELIITNQQYPALSFREADPGLRDSDMDFVSANGRLTCRWKYSKTSNSEGVLERLTDVESDEGCSVPQAELRSHFRGRTIKGGICPGWLDEEIAFEQVRQTRSRIDGHGPSRLNPGANETCRQHQRRYTFFDAYCGGGGVSSGAQKAGLRLQGAFDQDPDSIATYRLNFPHANSQRISAYDFAVTTNLNYKCDVLHMSPPCPPFSPLHTRPFPNDEHNQAAFLAAGMLLKRITPRIVTLEQTFGLVRGVDNLEWFGAMVHMFTELGFSVRWKVFNMLDFGLAQPRRRLLIFASCPGEALPDFPEPTHRKAGDLHRFPHRSPYTTVNDAISHIPRNFPDHRPQIAASIRHREPYSGDEPLRNTICCSGSLSYHPSGLRCFTNRELACLNGFTLEHRFGPRGARKQIGNAVPPIVMKVFLEQVVRALRMADGL